MGGGLENGFVEWGKTWVIVTEEQGTLKLLQRESVSEKNGFRKRRNFNLPKKWF